METSALIAQLADEDGLVQFHAANELVKQGDLESLTLALGQTENRDVRAQIVSILARRGDKNALPALIKVAQHDEDYPVRYVAVNALKRFGSEPLVIEALAEIVQEEDADFVSDNASEALIYWDRERAGQVYTELLKNHPSIGMRMRAAENLGGIGYLEAVPVLIAALQDVGYEGGEYAVCHYAVLALENIGTPEALEAVQKWWENPPDWQTEEELWNEE